MFKLNLSNNFIRKIVEKFIRVYLRERYGIDLKITFHNVSAEDVGDLTTIKLNVELTGKTDDIANLIK